MIPVVSLTERAYQCRNSTPPPFLELVAGTHEPGGPSPKMASPPFFALLPGTRALNSSQRAFDSC